MKNQLALLFAVLCLAVLAHGQNPGQVIVTCATPSVCPTPASITVSANPQAIAVQGTSVLTAIAVDSTSTNNINITGQCVWTSSNPAVLSVSNNTATGVSPGTATANCTPVNSNITGSSPVTITVTNLVILNPTCGTPPCTLPSGVNATAYGPYTFTAAGGTAPYTWTVSTGNFNSCFSIGNSALSSSGVLSATSGQVTTGVCTPTIQVADSASHTQTLQVSLTINATGCVAGPPNYGCTPTVVQQPGAFAPTAYPFSGPYSTCSPGPYPACGGVDNTLVSIPEPASTNGLYQNPIVRLTNAASGCGNYTEPACPTKQNFSFFVDSGSGDVYHWNTLGTRFCLVDSGATNYFYSFNESTMQATFLYSSYGSNGSYPGNASTMQLQKQCSYSPTQQYIFYATSNTGVGTGCNPGCGDGYYLNKWDTTSTSVVPVPSNIYNFTSSPNCLPTTITAATDPVNVGVISGADAIFEDAFSTASAQNTARYVAAYKVGSGCTVWNVAAGTVTGDWGTTGKMVCQNCILTTSISTITCGIGTGSPNCNATVSGTAGFNAGDQITISGSSTTSPPVNGTWSISAILSTTTFSFKGPSSISATGGTVTDNTPSPGSFQIHNNKISKNGTYAIVYVETCDPSPNLCFNKTSPYVWQIGTTNVWTNCPAASGNECSGHSASGNVAFYNGYNTPYNSSHPFATPGTPTAFPSVGTFPCSNGASDYHIGYQNMSDGLDDLALVGTNAPNNGSAPNYTYCTQGEVFGVYPPSAGGNANVYKRFGHTYQTSSGCFSDQYGIGSVSQDGKFYAFSSNMQSLGCMNGATSGCTATTSCSTTTASPRGDVFVMKLQ